MLVMGLLLLPPRTYKMHEAREENLNFDIGIYRLSNGFSEDTISSLFYAKSSYFMIYSKCQAYVSKHWEFAQE